MVTEPGPSRNSTPELAAVARASRRARRRPGRAGRAAQPAIQLSWAGWVAGCWVTQLAHLGRGARGRGARGAHFARGRGARGAGLHPRAPLPTLVLSCETGRAGVGPGLLASSLSRGHALLLGRSRRRRAAAGIGPPKVQQRMHRMASARLAPGGRGEISGCTGAC